MQKIVTLLRRAPGLGRDEFRARWLAELDGLLARAGAPRRCVASFVDVPPQEVGLDPGATPLPAHDAVVETWWDPADDSAPLERLLASASGSLAQAFSYRVREIVQKDCARSWPLGQRSPGVKGVYAVTRSPGLTPAEFERHWREVHGPLALRHHVGMSKYVQDVVLEALEPGAPLFDGFSELHFPTSRDMRERFVDSPEGGRRIAQDVAKFVGDALRLDSSEYVLS